MALIDFPSSPAIGATYTFSAGTELEKKFIFKTGATGASDGYWASAIVNAFLPATSLEINNGIINDKWISPQAIHNSHFVSRQGAVMFGYLSGVEPQDPQNFATKNYSDAPPNIYEEIDPTTTSMTISIPITTKGKGLVDFTAHVNTSGVYDSIPGHDIAATVYLQVYDAANTTLIHDMPLTKSSSNSTGHGQWPTATVRMLKVLSPDTSYVIRVTKAHGYNPLSGYTRIIGVAS